MDLIHVVYHIHKSFWNIYAHPIYICEALQEEVSWPNMAFIVLNP